jgi:hypothetical protein
VTDSQLISGEWFYQTNVKETGEIDCFVLLPNGTGAMIYTYYLEAATVVSMDPNYQGEQILDLTWTFDGKTLNIVLDFIGVPVELTYQYDKQKNEMRSSDGGVLTREKPAIPQGWESIIVLAGNAQRIEKSLQRSFLGSWHYDNALWTFNLDWTGSLYIPSIGSGAEETLNFTYKVMENDYSDCSIALNFAKETDIGSIVCLCTFGSRSGGSVTLGGQTDSDPMLLTRNYDLSNLPLTSGIVKGAFSIFDGESFLKGIFGIGD